MPSENFQLLFSREQIELRTREISSQITADYRGRPIVIIGVLKGCFVFLADIIRNLDLDSTIDFVQLASYGTSRKSSGAVNLTKDVDIDIQGCDILIVEDIVDTGETLVHLIEELQQRSPASVRVCALLSKQCRRRVTVVVDYIGFQVEDVFVVGYGLDFDERYRALPDIYALPPEGQHRYSS